MRVILKTYSSQQIAEVIADRLRELDIPIVTMQQRGPEIILGRGGPWEVWLEDETILENEVWRKQIEEVLSSDNQGLTPEEEEMIANMPVED